MRQRQEITALLVGLSGGSREAVDALMPRVYDELREMAHRQLLRERAGHTLKTTALVHEAYIKLVDQNQVDWKNRAHFFSVAAISMRRILINYARSRLADKRGGGEILATFDEELVVRETRAEDLLALDEALVRLQALSERQSKVVTFRFFGGLTQEEIAEVLGVSTPTVRRDWRLARAWLSRELRRMGQS